ncbi:unnamed protein product [Durusdinium trenchii]|uniref:Uncharacterized protein n=2 Tax=Durusdinium trenchii TaxID=1381693 RepID=A0ABP0LIW1_9DINO
MADEVYVPAHLRPPAGKTIMQRSSSDPKGLLRTTCGLSMSPFLTSTAVRVAPTRALEELRRDHIEGYRGFIPGVKAETVHGARSSVIDHIASDIRPLEFRPPQSYEWNRPRDPAQSLRSHADCEIWRTWQQDPKYNWMGGERPKDCGPGIAAYTGHRHLKQSRPKLQEDEAHSLPPGQHLRLPRQMPLGLARTSEDWDPHPVDVIRPQMPGYRAFLPGRKLMA